MTDYSTKLAAFAARLGAEPEAVQAVFDYCLAVLEAKKRRARLVKIELRGSEPWCIFKTDEGDELAIFRPFLSQAEERRMIRILREILEPEDLIPEEEDNLPLPSPAGLEEVALAAAPLPEVVASAVETADSDTETAQPLPEAITRPAGLEDYQQAVESLQPLVAQARQAAQELQAIIDEVQNVTEAAWQATKEQYLVLAELRTALRQYERLRRDQEPLAGQKRREAEAPPRKRPVGERDKQITLALLEGMTVQKAAETFGLSAFRIKEIYDTQFRRLYRLQDVLGLSREDLAVIRGREHPHLLTGQRQHAPRIKELLEKMWAYEES